MNYLIIGNGFDLAHGYKTRYQDFLYWVKQEINLYDSLEGSEQEAIGLESNIDASVLDNIGSISKTYPNIQKEIWKLINCNFWLEYFIYYEDKFRDGWTGFENEISLEIQRFDSVMRQYMGQRDTNPISHDALDKMSQFIRDNSITSNSILLNTSKFSEISKKRYIVPGITTYKDFISRLSEDLSSLTRLFEIYLLYFSKRDVSKKKFTGIIDLKIDRVVSFNYTDSYRNLYDGSAEISFLHGQVDKSHKEMTDNLVLGIDEYLDADRESKEIEFINFKKYYQRIRKMANSDYLHWIQDFEPEKDNYGEAHNVYIIGHSLEKTDADVLNGFIKGYGVITTIYYYSDADYAQKVANLVQVLGKEELIKRTSGTYKTIYFVDQSSLM